MKAPSVKPVRCAIYTRGWTEHGLDQEFNSLDAQYDAASAYIKSQAHAGWTLIRSRYDDGGYSGGSTDRPDLQRLLDDIRARKLDVIVVYKVDRLTRSLADFAKLVELFDGPANAQRPAVLRSVREGGHFRAHPGQDRRFETERSVGRRSPPPWLSDERRQDCHRRERGRTDPADLPALSRPRRRQCTGARPPRAEHPLQNQTAGNRRDPWRRSLRPWLAVLSAAESLLCR